MLVQDECLLAAWHFGFLLPDINLIVGLIAASQLTAGKWATDFEPWSLSADVLCSVSSQSQNQGWHHFQSKNISFKLKKLKIFQDWWDLLSFDLVTITLRVVDVTKATNQLFERPETDRDKKEKSNEGHKRGPF